MCADSPKLGSNWTTGEGQKRGHCPGVVVVLPAGIVNFVQPLIRKQYATKYLRPSHISYYSVYSPFLES